MGKITFFFHVEPGYCTISKGILVSEIDIKELFEFSGQKYLEFETATSFRKRILIPYVSHLIDNGKLTFGTVINMITEDGNKHQICIDDKIIDVNLVGITKIIDFKKNLYIQLHILNK